MAAVGREARRGRGPASAEDAAARGGYSDRGRRRRLPCAAGAMPVTTATDAPPLARPAGRPGRVPGVSADAVQLGLGHGRDPELRRVRLADHDEAGVLQPANNGDVEVGHVVGETRGRRRSCECRPFLQVFVGNGTPVKRAVRRLRCERFVAADGDEGVQLGSSRSIRSRLELDELARGDFAATDQLRLLVAVRKASSSTRYVPRRRSRSPAPRAPLGVLRILGDEQVHGRGSSTIRAVPRSRTHQSFDQSSS